MKVSEIKENLKKTKRDGNNYWIRWKNRLHSHHNKKMGKIKQMKVMGKKRPIFINPNCLKLWDARE